MSTTMTSRQFNQDTSRAKRAAEKGPVFITRRGRLSHVLLSVEEYERLSAERGSLVDRLAMPEAAEIDFDPPRLGAIAKVPEDLVPDDLP